MGLGSARSDVTWINIWQDDDASAFVRTLRDGNETVPTPVTGEGKLLPMDAEAIKAYLATD